MQRLIGPVALLLIFVFLISPVRVSAAGIEWIDLLADYTLNDNGLNSFSYTSTHTIEFPFQNSTRVNKVDVLLYHTSGTAPTKVEVYDKSAWRSLTIQKISSTTTRVYGDVGGALFSSLQLRFTKSGTTSSFVELKSFKIYTLSTTFSSVTAGSSLSSTYYSTLSVSTGSKVTIPMDSSPPHYGSSFTLSTTVTNASAFDFVVMSVFLQNAGATSISATYGSHYVPFQTSFIDTESRATGENSTNSGEPVFTEVFNDNYISLLIDLSAIDRTKNSELRIEFTGNYNTAWGMSVVIEDLVGGLVLSDQTGATNWIRFKNFISDQFASLGSTLSTGFSNLSTWISTQTSTLKSAINSMTTTLNNALTTIKNAVSTGFTNVGTWISNQTTALLDKLDIFEDHVDLSFNTLFGVLDSYFGQDSSESEDFSDSMQSDSEQLQDAVDEMDSVLKPDVEDLDVSLDSYMSAEGMQPVNSFLAVVFGNQLIVTMLVISLTCAFASYALFGKR